MKTITYLFTTVIIIGLLTACAGTVQSVNPTSQTNLDEKYPLRVKIIELSWKCVVTYNAGWLNGGVGTVESSGQKGKKQQCPEPPGPYPVKKTEWYFFYMWKDLETDQVHYSSTEDLYLQESNWRAMSKGKFRCKKDFYRWRWEVACIDYEQ